MGNKYHEKPKHIGYATSVEAKCDYCNSTFWESLSAYVRKKRHFCNAKCYAIYRKEIMPPEEQPTWRGGVSNTEAHRRWKSKNPEQMAFLKSRRYAREKGAEGQHTFEQWNELKKQHKFRCSVCGKRKKLTKDHIKPLSLGGSDFIENIQPLCRNCNSKKWKKYCLPTTKIHLTRRS